MNLLCPNCQKTLTIPEQFAGQLMKCPLCSKQFTVPSLPPGVGAVDPVLSTPPPATGVPAAAASSTSPASPAGHEPVPAFSSSSASSSPAAGTPAESPAFATAPPAASEPESEPAFPVASSSSPATTPTLAPAPLPRAGDADAGGGYTKARTLRFREAVLKWIPPAALVLIFVLQFFPWVGVYPGGIPAVTQNAWQAAFGMADTDPDLKDRFRIITEEEAEKNKDAKNPLDRTPNRPGISPLLLFYLFPFFVLTLVATLFVAIQPHIQVTLPAQIQQLLPWKWTILAGLNVILLLFLTLQLLLNFSLESSYKTWIENDPELKKDPSTMKSPDKKESEVRRGEYLQQLRRTNYLTMAFLLHLLSTVAAGLVYWLERRGPDKPEPVLELRY